MTSFLSARARRAGALAVAVLLAAGLLLPSAQAADGWVNVGAAKSTSRGSNGSVDLQFDSTTRRDPQALQFEIISNATIDLNVSTIVWCWGHASRPDLFIAKQGFRTVTAAAPYVETWGATDGVPGYALCSIDVFVHEVGTPATVVARTSAQY